MAGYKRLAATLIGLFLTLSIIWVGCSLPPNMGPDENKASPIYFGVSFGLNTSREAKLLIDKVKDYTNLLVINSWSISTNETALNEVCDYAVHAKLNFIVFFSFISRIAYPWHQSWLDMAKNRWGDRFKGVYLFDEPGGRQIDRGEWSEGTAILFRNASSYSEAAAIFTNSIRFINSTGDLKKRGIPMYTSDYALYWFDYLAGYDCVFVEFGWNHSRIRSIALGRGAAHVQDRDWGVIVTWTYTEPPYIEDAAELYRDLVTAYRAGAKYIIVFNYPKINEYGILSEEHFGALQKFWSFIHSPASRMQRTKAEAAYVLPKDYGWGMRSPEDKIWGIWPPDQLSQKIWSDVAALIQKYSLKLDIIYDDPKFNYTAKYPKLYFWNRTIA